MKQKSSFIRILALMGLTFLCMDILLGNIFLFEPGGGILIALPFVFGDVQWEGGDNIGGFTSKAFLGIAHEIDTWPTQDRNATTDDGMVQLQGSYLMKPGKKFYEIYVTQRTPGGESENQGEIDGKSFLQKVSFFVPATSKQNAAFARKINNTRGVILMKDPNTGSIIQFGDEDFPLHFKPRLSSGNQPTDRRGLFVEAEADNFNAILFYPGTIPLTAAPSQGS